MWWQGWVRAAVMAVSAAVIAVTGGQALVRGAGDAGADDLRPLAVTGVASGLPGTRDPAAGAGRRSSPFPAAGGAPEGAGSDASTLRAAPPLVSLALAARRRTRHGARVVLRARLVDVVSGAPTSGQVTLWRVARSGRWTPVLTRQEVSAVGALDLVVAQAGRTATYQLTSAATVAHQAGTSARVIVRRG